MQELSNREHTGLQEYKLVDHSILFVGNPGTGKSSLLNTLGGEFAAGYNAGSGLTQSILRRNITTHGETVQLVDIPGINEPAQQERNMDLLRQAIQEAEGIKVVFLVRSDAGRLSHEDLALVNTLIEGTKGITKVGIIVNKCSKKDVEHSETLENECREHIRKAGASLSFDFLFVRRYEEPETEQEGPPPNTTERLLTFLKGFVPEKVEIKSFWDRLFEGLWAFWRTLMGWF